MEAFGCGCADARRCPRIDGIEIEAQAITCRLLASDLKRLLHCPCKAMSLHFLHKDHPYPKLLEQVRLFFLIAPHPNKAYLVGFKLRFWIDQLGELRGAITEQAGKRHPVRGSTGTGCRRMAVHVRVDPDETQGALITNSPGGSAPGAYCAGMV